MIEEKGRKKMIVCAKGKGKNKRFDKNEYVRVSGIIYFL